MSSTSAKLNYFFGLVVGLVIGELAGCESLLDTVELVVGAVIGLLLLFSLERGVKAWRHRRAA